MGLLFGRKPKYGRQSREPEVTLVNLCCNCRRKKDCIYGMQYGYDEDYGMVKCAEYRSE